MKLFLYVLYATTAIGLARVTVKTSTLKGNQKAANGGSASFDFGTDTGIKLNTVKVDSVKLRIDGFCDCSCPFGCTCCHISCGSGGNSYRVTLECGTESVTIQPQSSLEGGQTTTLTGPWEVKCPDLKPASPTLTVTNNNAHCDTRITVEIPYTAYCEGELNAGLNSCECPKGYFGASCQKCTCQNGECKDGLGGSGDCKTCKVGYYGLNCERACNGADCKACLEGAEAMTYKLIGLYNCNWCVDVQKCQGDCAKPALAAKSCQPALTVERYTYTPDGMLSLYGTLNGASQFTVRAEIVHQPQNSGWRAVLKQIFPGDFGDWKYDIPFGKSALSQFAAFKSDKLGAQLFILDAAGKVVKETNTDDNILLIDLWAPTVTNVECTVAYNEGVFLLNMNFDALFTITAQRDVPTQTPLISASAGSNNRDVKRLSVDGINEVWSTVSKVDLAQGKQYLPTKLGEWREFPVTVMNKADKKSPPFRIRFPIDLGLIHSVFSKLPLSYMQTQIRFNIPSKFIDIDLYPVYRPTKPVSDGTCGENHVTTSVQLTLTITIKPLGKSTSGTYIEIEGQLSIFFYSCGQSVMGAKLSITIPIPPLGLDLKITGQVSFTYVRSEQPNPPPFLVLSVFRMEFALELQRVIEISPLDPLGPTVTNICDLSITIKYTFGGFFAMDLVDRSSPDAMPRPIVNVMGYEMAPKAMYFGLAAGISVIPKLSIGGGLVASVQIELKVRASVIVRIKKATEENKSGVTFAVALYGEGVPTICVFVICVSPITINALLCWGSDGVQLQGEVIIVPPFNIPIPSASFNIIHQTDQCKEGECLCGTAGSLYGVTGGSKFGTEATLQQPNPTPVFMTPPQNGQFAVYSSEGWGTPLLKNLPKSASRQHWIVRKGSGNMRPLIKYAANIKKYYIGYATLQSKPSMQYTVLETSFTPTSTTTVVSSGTGDMLEMPDIALVQGIIHMVFVSASGPISVDVNYQRQFEIICYRYLSFSSSPTVIQLSQNEVVDTNPIIVEGKGNTALVVWMQAPDKTKTIFHREYIVVAREWNGIDWTPSLSSEPTKLNDFPVDVQSHAAAYDGTAGCIAVVTVAEQNPTVQYSTLGTSGWLPLRPWKVTYKAGEVAVAQRNTGFAICFTANRQVICSDTRTGEEITVSTDGMPQRIRMFRLSPTATSVAVFWVDIEDSTLHAALLSDSSWAVSSPVGFSSVNIDGYMVKEASMASDGEKAMLLISLSKYVFDPPGCEAPACRDMVTCPKLPDCKTTNLDPELLLLEFPLAGDLSFMTPVINAILDSNKELIGIEIAGAVRNLGLHSTSEASLTNALNIPFREGWSSTFKKTVIPPLKSGESFTYTLTLPPGVTCGELDLTITAADSDQNNNVIKVRPKIVEIRGLRTRPATDTDPTYDFFLAGRMVGPYRGPCEVKWFTGSGDDRHVILTSTETLDGEIIQWKKSFAETVFPPNSTTLSVQVCDDNMLYTANIQLTGPDFIVRLPTIPSTTTSFDSDKVTFPVQIQNVGPRSYTGVVEVQVKLEGPSGRSIVLTFNQKFPAKMTSWAEVTASIPSVALGVYRVSALVNPTNKITELCCPQRTNLYFDFILVIPAEGSTDEFSDAGLSAVVDTPKPPVDLSVSLVAAIAGGVQVGIVSTDPGTSSMLSCMLLYPISGCADVAAAFKSIGSTVTSMPVELKFNSWPAPNTTPPTSFSAYTSWLNSATTATTADGACLQQPLEELVASHTDLCGDSTKQMLVYKLDLKFDETIQSNVKWIFSVYYNGASFISATIDGTPLPSAGAIGGSDGKTAYPITADLSAGSHTLSLAFHVTSPSLPTRVDFTRGGSSPILVSRTSLFQSVFGETTCLSSAYTKVAYNQYTSAAVLNPAPSALRTQRAACQLANEAGATKVAFVDSDATPSVLISITTTSMVEGAAPADIQIVLPVAMGSSTIAKFSANDDRIAFTPPSITWLAGDTGVRRVKVFVVDDHVLQKDDISAKISVTLTPSSGIKVEPSSLMMTIIDNEQSGWSTYPPMLYLYENGTKLSRGCTTIGFFAMPKSTITLFFEEVNAFINWPGNQATDEVTVATKQPTTITPREAFMGYTHCFRAVQDTKFDRPKGGVAISMKITTQSQDSNFNALTSSIGVTIYDDDTETPSLTPTVTVTASLSATHTAVDVLVAPSLFQCYYTTAGPESCTFSYHLGASPVANVQVTPSITATDSPMQLTSTSVVTLRSVSDLGQVSVVQSAATLFKSTQYVHIKLVAACTQPAFAVTRTILVAFIDKVTKLKFDDTATTPGGTVTGGAVSFVYTVPGLPSKPRCDGGATPCEVRVSLKQGSGTGTSDTKFSTQAAAMSVAPAFHVLSDTDFGASRGFTISLSGLTAEQVYNLFVVYTSGDPLYTRTQRLAVPLTYIQASAISVSGGSNPGDAPSPRVEPQSPTGSDNQWVGIGIGIGAGALVLIGIIVAIVFIVKKQASKARQDPWGAREFQQGYFYGASPVYQLQGAPVNMVPATPANMAIYMVPKLRNYQTTQWV